MPSWADELRVSSVAYIDTIPNTDMCADTCSRSGATFRRPLDCCVLSEGQSCLSMATPGSPFLGRPRTWTACSVAGILWATDVSGAGAPSLVGSS